MLKKVEKMIEKIKACLKGHCFTVLAKCNLCTNRPQQGAFEGWYCELRILYENDEATSPMSVEDLLTILITTE